jgi:hypothetical protein
MTQRRNKSAAPSIPAGWSTSDEDEVERRRLRSVEEAISIESLTTYNEFFGDYRCYSDSGREYRVEIRSLSERINSCNCPDHRINGLGTCKHVEAALYRLQHRRKRAYREAAAADSPCIEIYLDRRDNRIRIRWPSNSKRRSRARDALSSFFSPDYLLLGDTLDSFPALQRTIDALGASVKRRIRVSEELKVWLVNLDERAQRQRSRQHFEAEVAAGKASLALPLST